MASVTTTTITAATEHQLVLDSNSVKEDVELLDELDQWKRSSTTNSGTGRRAPLPILAKLKLTKPSVNVVITGMTGVGKSSLANSLAGKKECREGVSTAMCTMASKKVTAKRNGYEINIWDTPGFTGQRNQDDDFMRDLSNRTCLGKEECDILVYAITMEKTRLEKNDDNFEVMKKLSCCFGKKVWRNAVIVLTNANMYIGLLTERNLSNEELSLRYKMNFQDWVGRLRKFLGESVDLPKEITSSIQIATAGYDVNKKLETDPDGVLWMNNLWLSFLRSAKSTVQPLVEKIVSEQVFSGSDVCGETLLRFIKAIQSVYVARVSSLCTRHPIQRRYLVGSIYSSLCALDYVLKHHAVIGNLSFAGSSALLDYCRAISLSADVLFVGGAGAGKTSLINSMFYGREFLPEGNDISLGTTIVSATEIRYSNLTCRVRDTPKLTDQYCIRDIACKCPLDRAGLLVFCIGTMEDKLRILAGIRKLTDKFGQEIWRKALIVLTYANINDSPEDYVSMIQSWTDFLEEIFQIFADPDNPTANVGGWPVIVPAGYHKDIHINGEESHMFWVVNLWMKAISVAQSEYQPMLIKMLNSHLQNSVIGKGQRSGDIIMHYRHQLLQLLNTIPPLMSVNVLF